MTEEIEADEERVQRAWCGTEFRPKNDRILKIKKTIKRPSQHKWSGEKKKKANRRAKRVCSVEKKRMAKEMETMKRGACTV